MEFRTCGECGDYAVLKTKGGRAEGHLCLDCLDREELDHRMDRYICSVAECGNAPYFLVVLEEGGRRSMLVCEQHFNRLKDMVSSYLTLPGWLTNGNDLTLGENGVTIEMDFDAEFG